jgi:hypothetical protein
MESTKSLFIVYTFGYVLTSTEEFSWLINICIYIYSSNLAKAVGFLRAKNSFGGEVRPSVPCHRFAACKRSLNGVDVVISAKLPDNISRPQFHLSLLGSLTSLTWRHLAMKVGTSKGGEK